MYPSNLEGLFLLHTHTHLLRRFWSPSESEGPVSWRDRSHNVELDQQVAIVVWYLIYSVIFTSRHYFKQQSGNEYCPWS